MRFRIWAQIGLTVAVNLLLLGTLTAGFLVQQSRTGIQSILYAPARERIRELGALVEEEFPQMPDSQRTAWLEKLQKPYGVTLAVYEDTGRLVAGPDLKIPDIVRREIQADRNRPRQDRDRAAAESPPADGPPMFFVKEENPARYWIGYHFPIVLVSGHPPVRHTLAVVAPSLLMAPLFADWIPWTAGAGLVLLLIAACWIPLIRHITRSVHSVRLAAAEIAQGRFDVQIPVESADELGDLAHSIRRMAEQLSVLVHGQRRFLADVAHELCAPLSRIQLSTGIIAQRATAADSKSADRLERDVAHMSALVNDLLSFTRVATRKPDLGPVALADLVRRVVTQECDPGTDVSIEVDPSIVVIGNPDYLQRAVGNIVRNAIRYAAPAGPITIRATRAGSAVQLVVKDCGPGLPESDLDAIFSPFYRPDSVRTPGSNGSGLGLAIVKECVEVCQGMVCCRNCKPKGLEVVIELKSAA